MGTRFKQRDAQVNSPQPGRQATVVLPLSPAEIAAWRNHHLQRAQRHLDYSRHHRREAFRYEPPAIQTALDIIESHLTDRLTLAQVARHAGLSTGQVSCQLKKTTGCKFSRYVATRRIEVAKDLLLDFPRKKVSTVSDEAGFQSWPDFYFWFKRLTGLTPTEYRRKACRRKPPRKKKPGKNGAGKNGYGKKKRSARG